MVAELLVRFVRSNPDNSQRYRCAHCVEITKPHVRSGLAMYQNIGPACSLDYESSLQLGFDSLSDFFFYKTPYASEIRRNGDTVRL